MGGTVYCEGHAKSCSRRPCGMVFHVLNRGNDRREIFDDRADYEAFLRVMKETQERVPMRVNSP